MTRVEFPFEERTLGNGLRVIVQEDHTAPVVAVHVMYHVGSKHEKRGRSGFAHLFEHLLFQGSEHVGDDKIFEYVQNAGGTLNGTTWFDRTNYFETLPSNALELGLWLESDRMGFFESTITQRKLDNQRDVVKNERRQAYENRPYGLAVETILRLAYPERHPYRHPTIGYMEDLDAATVEDVRAFFRAHYTPNNAVLVLAGDVTVDRGFKQVERYFGELKAGPAPRSVTAPVPPPKGEVRDVLYDRVQFPRVYFFHHAPGLGHPGFEAADLLCYVLASGKSSRLYRSLVYTERLAQDVSAQLWPTEDTGGAFVVATARPAVKAGRLENAIRRVLDDVVESGVGERELSGARNRALRDLVGHLDGVGPRSDAFATAATYLS
ncbi:MAG: M16 family metallopeptidase, partial [Gemmatimonadota bacterium]